MYIYGAPPHLFNHIMMSKDHQDPSYQCIERRKGMIPSLYNCWYEIKGLDNERFKYLASRDLESGLVNLSHEPYINNCNVISPSSV